MHIRVELDFVPVEEGLPGRAGYYPVLEYGQWYLFRAALTASGWRDTRGDIVDVTHWAEIPEVPDAG